MKERTISARGHTAVARMPSEADVRELKIGDLAPDCFGRLSKVTEIFARDVDIHGDRFVCYYTEFGANGSMSHSMKEGELVRTVPLTAALNSAECDQLESDMR